MISLWLNTELLLLTLTLVFLELGKGVEILEVEMYCMQCLEGTMHAVIWLRFLCIHNYVT